MVDFPRIMQRLNKKETLDWGDVPRNIWLEVTSGKLALPQYDCILIDEAQFFAPIWMDLIKRALKKQNSHLFVVADPTQGFLGRHGTWKSIGLEARGRTHKLQHSYRTTHEILQFATLFYRLRLPSESDEDILPPDLLNMPKGTFPWLIPLKNAQDEIARVTNEVVKLLHQGIPRRHILVVHTKYEGVDALIKLINLQMGKDIARDARETYPGNYVRVTTINASPGIESPIVFLVGLKTLFEQEQSVRLSVDEREKLIMENTRRVFMAATRAGQRLILTYVGQLPDVFHRMIHVEKFLIQDAD